jgi:hypothetical protein
MTGPVPEDFHTITPQLVVAGVADAIAWYTSAFGANEARWLWTKLEKLHELNDDDVVWRIRALSNLREDKTAGDQIEEVVGAVGDAECLDGVVVVPGGGVG